jgi:tetratricopeptide (TPR) repeat protein
VTASTLSQDVSGVASRTKEIFETRCFKCHGLNGQAEAGVFILDRERLVAERQVIPGDKSSKLLRLIETGFMPADLFETGEKLPEEEVKAVRTWIEAGAPEFLPAKREPRTFLRDEALVAEIVRDLSQLPERERKHMRYFSIAHLYNAGVPGERPEVSEDELEGHRIGLAKLLNSLSWQKRISIPLPVDQSRTLLRIDLRDYSWTPDNWRKVVESYPYGIRYAGADLVAQLSGAVLPYIRADWFVRTAARPPLYHALLDLPDKVRDLEKRLGVDGVKNFADEKRMFRAGLRKSGVSRNNRVIERHEAAHGAYWRSYDFATSVAEQNIFKNPLELDPAGGEMIFNLPNGLQGYMITSAGGDRIDEAPTNIVFDKGASDPVVRTGISCMKCHYAGMKVFTDDMRPVLTQLAGSKPTFDLAKALVLYAPQATIDSSLKGDAEAYRRAIEAAGGKVSSNERTEPVNALSRKYEDDLTVGQAAAEAGLDVPAFQERLKRSPRLVGALGFGQLLVSGGGYKRDAWEEYFGELVKELELGTFLENRTGHAEDTRDLTVERQASNKSKGSTTGLDAALAEAAHLRVVGRFEDAIAAYRRITQAAPDCADGHYESGLLLHEQGRAAEAIDALRAATKAAPGHLQAHFQLIMLLPKAEAVGAYRRRVDQEDTCANRVLHAYALLMDGRRDEAVAQAREALRLDGTSAEAHCVLGMALTSTNQSTEALAELRDAVRLNAAYSVARSHLGWALFRQGDAAGARTQFQEMLRLEPQRAWAHGSLGQFLLEIKDFEGAAREAEEAVRLAPKVGIGHWVLGCARFGAKDNCGSLIALKEAARLSPESAMFRLDLGAVLVESKDYCSAIRVYKEAIQLDANSPVGHWRLGIAYTLTKDWVSAETEMREAVRLAPRGAIYRRELGNIFIWRGNFEAAITVLKQAISLSDDAESHNLLGVAYSRQSKFSAAAAEYREALKINPAYEPASSNLKLLVGY